MAIHVQPAHFHTSHIFAKTKKDEEEEKMFEASRCRVKRGTTDSKRLQTEGCRLSFGLFLGRAGHRMAVLDTVDHNLHKQKQPSTRKELQKQERCAKKQKKKTNLE